MLDITDDMKRFWPTEAHVLVALQKFYGGLEIRVTKSWKGQSIIHPLSNEASFVISNMHCLNGKPIAFMRLEERTHFVTAILCKVPHAVSDALIEEIVPNVAKATQLTVYSAQLDETKEGKNNPPQSSDRIPRALRDEVLDSRTESVFQVSKVRAHCESLHSLIPKMSNMRGDPLIGCMSKEQRPKHRTKGEVCQLRGGPPGVKQAMQKTEGNSTNPHRENTRTSEAGCQTTKGPNSHRLSQSGPRQILTTTPPSPSRVTLQR